MKKMSAIKNKTKDKGYKKMINLRKPAFIPDGSITAAKIAPGAVTSEKIALDVIDTSHIKNNAITTAKAVEALRRHVYVGDETEVAITGTTEVAVKEFSVAKSTSPLLDWKFMNVQALIKTNNPLYTATLLLYFNDETIPRMTITTTETDYELKSAQCSMDGLLQTKNVVVIKMKSSDPEGIAYNELIDIFTEI